MFAKSQKLRHTAAAIALSIATGLAPSFAQAAEVNENRPVNDMMHHILMEEGHRIVAGWNEIKYDRAADDLLEKAHFLTATPSGSDWYIIQGDKPVGEEPANITVMAKGTDLIINDYRDSMVLASGIRTSFDEARAIEKCKEIQARNGVGVCNELGNMLTAMRERYGWHVAAQGTSTLNGREFLLTITADPEEGDFRSLMTSSEGATIISGNGDKFKLLPHILEELDNGAKRAGVPPKIQYN